MAVLNSSIVLIALPDVFRGIGIDPLAPGETTVLLWSLMGYLVVTAVLLVTCGRLSDVFGRVRLYNFGFLIFTLGSILLFFIQGSGDSAALQIIGFRIVQGIGGAFLFANSTAILTDAFSPSERGFALCINQMAGIAGSFLGLIIGGLLVTVSWRAVFLAASRSASSAPSGPISCSSRRPSRGPAPTSTSPATCSSPAASPRC